MQVTGVLADSTDFTGSDAVTPLKSCVPALNVLLAFSSGTLFDNRASAIVPVNLVAASDEITVAPCVPVTSPVSAPVNDAALPVTFIPAVPALKFAGVKLVIADPLPASTLLALDNVSGLLYVPLRIPFARLPLEILPAFRAVRFVPVPVKAVAF